MRRGLASGREDAKRLIARGSVTVDGSSLVKASTMVSDSASIELAAAPPAWASRGGHKLAHALDEFGIDPTGWRGLDVGASTGGFTDVLLSRGASAVTALDVGYGQLVWRLRQDPRVTVVDRTNFRTLDPTDLEPPFDITVVDVSFISVRLIADQLAAVGRTGADYVVLVKPQFEVGKDRVGRGGIVADPAAHLGAISGVSSALRVAGIGPIGVTRSPITGSKGNIEFLLHGVLGAEAALPDSSVEAVVAP